MSLGDSHPTTQRMTQVLALFVIDLGCSNFQFRTDFHGNVIFVIPNPDLSGRFALCKGFIIHINIEMAGTIFDIASVDHLLSGIPEGSRHQVAPNGNVEGELGSL